MRTRSLTDSSSKVRRSVPTSVSPPWKSRMSRVAREDGRSGRMFVSARRKKVAWKPKRRPLSVRREPVRYHHSVAKSGWLAWSRGKSNSRSPSALRKASSRRRITSRAESLCDFAREIADDDTVVEKDGVKVVVDPAAVALDDAVDHGQAQARTVAGPLGGEEGFEDVFELVLGDPVAGVEEGEADVGTGTGVTDSGQVFLLQHDVVRPQGQDAAVGHGVNGIENQVGKHFFEFRAVNQQSGGLLKFSCELNGMAVLLGEGRKVPIVAHLPMPAGTLRSRWHPPDPIPGRFATCPPRKGQG